MKKILIVLVGLILAAAVFFLMQKNTKDVTNPILITDDELKEKIGQMIIVGFRGTEATENSEIYKIIRDLNVGGVVLFDYDVPSKSSLRNIENSNQVEQLISSLQEYSQTPLFVSVDAEGGKVNRLKPEYGFLPILSAQEMGQDKSLKITNTESQKLSDELSQLGFNLNFAPVVDLNTNKTNPIISALGRSFSADPNIIFENAEVFIENLEDKKIIAVAKHFPGHGSSTTDSHLGLVDVTQTYNDNELEPYKKLIGESKIDAIMTAHIINKNIDPGLPATLSPKFLQNILRDDLGFKGVIISDDIQMGAITQNYGLKEAVILAVNAGCNILIASNNTDAGYDKNISYKIRDIIFNAVKNGEIQREKINESYNLIINLKKKFEIIK